MNEDKIVEDYLNAQLSCLGNLREASQIIKNIFEKLISARDNDQTIYIMGNGGSASTATHFTSDLLKTSIIKSKKRFRAHSLSDNIPVVLAWANDDEYNSVFLGQLENFLKKNDIVIGFSGSGNSENVIKATISFTGKGGGNLSKISQINLTIPSDDMLTIETMHLLICHLLTTMVRADGEPQFSY